MKSLVLLTHRFPGRCRGADEGNFLAPELPALRRCFDRLIIVPGMQGEGLWDLDDQSVVDRSAVARVFRNSPGNLIRNCAAGLRSPLSWREWFVQGRRLVRYPSAIPQMWRYIGRAKRLARILEQLGAKYALGEDTVFYSYWLSVGALALACFKRHRNGRAIAVSRGHGFDVYEEREPRPELFGRAFTMRNLDRVYPISQDGCDNLAQRYPNEAQRFKVMRLGTPTPTARNRPSTDGVTRLLSCSSVNEVKRVDLIHRVLEALANLDRARRYEWTHIGDGPLYAALKTQVEAGGSGRLRCRLLGAVQREAIYHYYQSSPVDVFINLSRSEGIPVAVMEALSHGVPAFCTAVGGSPEAVGGCAGWLVPPDLNETEIALRLQRADLRNPTCRLESYNHWFRHFDAQKQFALFADELAKLALRGSSR